jgi:uncharacterized protein YegL
MSSEQLQSFMIPGSGYGYTGAAVRTLTSFENTIAMGLLDESGSTNSYAKPMEETVKNIIKSLRKNPRADNLIYRQSHFATNYREHHGFMPLGQINESQYDGCYKPGGATHLYDACDRSLREMIDYAEKQLEKKFLCNGILYIITDGCDYGSTLTQNDVKAALAKAISCEALESLVTILIGVNDDPTIQANLEQFQKNVGFTAYYAMKSADEASLAQLTNGISQSISSQSQALGTGGPSQQIQSLVI